MIAEGGRRCDAVIEFAGMVLQCQRSRHGPGYMHRCEWYSTDGKHRVEWNSQLSKVEPAE